MKTIENNISLDILDDLTDNATPNYGPMKVEIKKISDPIAFPELKSFYGLTKTFLISNTE